MIRIVPFESAEVGELCRMPFRVEEGRRYFSWEAPVMNGLDWEEEIQRRDFERAIVGEGFLWKRVT